jgi:hypothetical protein
LKKTFGRKAIHKSTYLRRSFDTIDTIKYKKLDMALLCLFIRGSRSASTNNYVFCKLFSLFLTYVLQHIPITILVTPTIIKIFY